MGIPTPPLPSPDLGQDTLPFRSGMGYPPVKTWDGYSPPPPPRKCEQTENITFPHPSDAGGKYTFGEKRLDYCSLHVKCTEGAVFVCWDCNLRFLSAGLRDAPY